MAFTYEWEVTSLKVRDQVNQEGETLTDAVVQTYWKVKGIDENGNEGEFSGATPFTAENVPSGSFVNFSSLQESDVIGWIQAVVNGDQGYKDHIDEQIQRKIDEELKIEKEAAMPWKIEADVTPTPEETAPEEVVEAEPIN